MKKLLSLFALLSLSLCVTVRSQERPNILLMMVDDLGFADFGCYGSEIETPSIDRLADTGVRFSQFYNTAKCHTSRIALLTGLYANQAGEKKLSRATTIATVLGDAGYTTSMTGKWHLAGNPMDFGFQRYWGHLSGATDFFVGDNTFRMGREPWAKFDEGFYTTDANVDYAMDFIDEALAAEKPFFHYIAFNAPHYPLQAPKEDIEKYLGRYDAGWETIREARFAKQKELGIFPDSMKLPPLPAHVPAWDSLSDHQRAFESFRMSIFAAMVDRVDQNIGRLVEYLEKKGCLDNTLILLCSDNGACPFERSKNIDIPPWEGGSFYLYDASWATVGNTPFRHYKQTQHEGGTSSPLVVNWPGKLKEPGRWERSPGHLIDLMATCIDVAETSYPDSPKIEPLQGKSLVPLFAGQTREGHEALYFQFSSCRALRVGDWKVASFYGSQWELYNIAEDRGEQHNLAAEHPEKLKQLSERWHRMAEEVDQAPLKLRKPVSSKPSTHEKDTWHKVNMADQWLMPKF